MAPRLPQRTTKTVFAETGFSLIELMMVVAILSLIAGIAIPVYNGYVTEARMGKMIMDIRAMDIPLKDYVVENGVAAPSLAAVGFDGELDAWGRPFQYHPIAGMGKNPVCRKDKNLHPINSDFDLYSLGEDGQSNLPLTAKASHDDIIRANDGAYLGLARDY